MDTYTRQDIVDMIGAEKLDNALNESNCGLMGLVEDDYIAFHADLGEFEAEINGELEEINIIAVWHKSEDDLDAVEDMSDLDWDQVSHFKIY